MIVAAMFVPGVLGVLGVLLVVASGRWFDAVWPALVGAVLVVVTAVILAVLVWQWRRPRLAFEGGRLLVYLRWGSPVAVPIEFVEGFLLGQGPSFLPGRSFTRSETATLVIRLADRAESWHRIDVEPVLGSWCGGYVTIRGTWCEPLGLDLINRLNARLREAQREPLAAARGT